jgi:hypothetical protein
VLARAVQVVLMRGGVKGAKGTATVAGSHRSRAEGEGNLPKLGATQAASKYTFSTICIW